MQLSREASHRLTAILCTVVAVAILAAGVTAQHENGKSVDTLTRLESDLRFQVQSAYRLRPREASKRLVQLDVVLEEFRANTRSNEDIELMANWLLQATRRSMPGTMAPLPVVPDFGQLNLPSTSKGSELAIRLSEESVERRIVPDTPKRSEPKAVSSPSPATADKSVELERKPVPVRTATQLVSSGEQTAVAQPRTRLVTVNLNELSARIAGFHVALDEMDAELYENPLPNEAEIGQYLVQLGSVLEDYHFVKLYYESLSAQERHSVAEPRSMDRLVAGIRRRIQKLQRAIQTDFLGKFDRSDAERVEQLDLQLDSLAERVSW